MTMFSIIISALILIGSFFILVGTVGIIRFPDIYCRLHAATKGPTLGIISIMAASILFFYLNGHGFSSRNLLTVIFVMATAPLGAYMIANASYHKAINLSKRSIIDELGEYMNKVEREDSL